MSGEDETQIIGMSEDGYKTLMCGSLIDLLAFHREFHPGVIEKFSTISDAELDLPSTFWEETRFPIRHRLHRYEAHIIQHTVQIDKTLAAIGQAPSESKRLVRYLFAALAEVNVNLIGKNNSEGSCLHLANIINSRIMEIKFILEN